MLEKRILWLVLLIGFSVSAQYKGVVIDSITGKPIPYVGIWTNVVEISFSADKKGKIEIKDLNEIETLFFFTSGYETKKVTINELKDEIKLVPKKQIEVTDLSLKKTEELKLLNNTINFYGAKQYFSVDDNETLLIAQYISYIPEIEKTKYLKSIKIGSQSEKQTAVYKVRFFAADSTGNPSDEIVTRDIICKSAPFDYDATNAKNPNYENSVQEIDLTKFGIVFPKNGLFIAIELMFLEENKLKLNPNNNDDFIKINPCVLLSNRKSNNIWEFHSGKWTQLFNTEEIAMKLTLTN